MSRQPFFPLISIRMQEQKGEVVIFQQKADDTMMVLHSQGSQPTLPDGDATLAKTEIIYPKNVRAKVAMDFT